jgi:DNA polymerase I
MLEYRIEPGGAAILEFRRQKDGRRVMERQFFKPYFHVDEHEVVALSKANMDRINHSGAKIIASEKRTLGGGKLQRIVVKKPSDVPTLRDLFATTYEADVPFTDRYRIDKGHEEPARPRILYIDIETKMSIDIEAPEPILMITVYDNYLKKYLTFGWSKNPKNQITKPDKKHSIFIDPTEQEFLLRFLDFWKDVDVDIITGWYTNGFDLPYIYNRLEKVFDEGVGKALSSLGRVMVQENGDIRIGGRYCFDMLPGYKKIHEGEMDSFKLDNVGLVELGMGKSGESMNVVDMWENKFGDLIKYSLRDVEILVGLDKKMGIIEFYRNLAKKTNCSLENSLFNSKLIDMYLLTMCSKRDICLPTKIPTEEMGKIKGAKVLDPACGLMENLAVFDIKSLYPNIIVSFNMSPETTLGYMKFDYSKKGLVPEALANLFAERQKLKDEGKDEQQRVVKEIMNTFYGAMLYKNFRLNNRDIGKSITFVGREILGWTKKIVEELGYKVVYGDTDSIFVQGVKSKEEGEEIRDKINKSYDDFAKKFDLTSHTFQIEFESFVERALFTGAKKRYALKIGSELKIRGFEFRRSNSARIGRVVQKAVLEKILNGIEEKEVIDYIKERKKYVEFEADLEDIGIPATLSKNVDDYETKAQHAEAARFSNKYLKGAHFVKGDKFMLVYIKKIPMNYPEKTSVVAWDSDVILPKGFDIDRKRHRMRSIDKLIDPILGVVGWSMEKAVSLLDFYAKT